MSQPEIRECPFTGRHVLFAPQRAERPMTLDQAQPVHRSNSNHAYCPFCPGNEHDTPEPVFVVSDVNGWQCRVVPNKFPAVRPDSPAFGLHEVLIPCREHITTPTQLTRTQFSRLFQVYAQRIRAIEQDPKIESVTLFQNVGAEAGASLAHLHSQLIALPFVPPELACELSRSSRARSCSWCASVTERSRVVAESKRFIAFCPVASRFAYEMCVLPKVHAARFESLSADEADELAELFQHALGALDRVLESPAYNWLLHTSPVEESPHYHWHFEIIPRTSRVAGFEWATGVFINSVLPEVAARNLRGN